MPTYYISNNTIYLFDLDDLCDFDWINKYFIWNNDKNITNIDKVYYYGFIYEIKFEKDNIYKIVNVKKEKIDF